jgi:hypothetical protein
MFLVSLRHDGGFSQSRKDTLMANASQKRTNQYSDQVMAKVRELTTLLAAEQFGKDGPPLKTKWSQIEEAGHQVGKLMATQFNELAQRQHAEHFDNEHACPNCGKLCKPTVKHRDFVTRDGATDLAEPEFECVACERSFFPSAS